MSVRITYFKGNKFPKRITIIINDISVKCYFNCFTDITGYGYFMPINNRQYSYSWLVRNLEAELPELFKFNQRVILRKAWGRGIVGGWPIGTIEEQVKLFKLIDEVQKEF